jgi:hypothetical protein
MDPEFNPFVNPEDIDASAEWRRVPVAEIFATELLPIMDSKPKLQCVFENAVAEWVMDSPWMKKRAGRWTYASHKVSPFMLTYSDGAATSVERAIETANDNGDPEARAYYAILDLLTDEADLQLPKATIRTLEKKLWAIEQGFEPQRDTARYWAPMHSCHSFNALPAFCLAHEWRRGYDWRVLTGQLHTTVVSLREKLVFELVLADDMETDVIEFACRPAPVEKAA